MSVLELARKAYARLRAQRNGHVAPPPATTAAPVSYRDQTCEKSELSEQRVRAEGVNSLNSLNSHYLFVQHAADLLTVANAIEETVVVGLDTETTGLDPRTDRVRLLSLDCDTDGGRFTYLIDLFAVDPSPLFEALAAKKR